MTMKYAHLLQAISRMPLAILPEKWAEIRGFLEAKANGVNFTQEEILAATGGKREIPEGATMFGSVAVIPVIGVLSQKANMPDDISKPGGTSTQILSQQLQAALGDQSVSSIALSIDSPGGSVFGIPELAEEIFQARKQKPITAIVDPMAASGALWLASQAGRIGITDSGVMGSIGVFAVHEDISKMREKMGIKTTIISAGKYKTEGNPFEPLTEEGYAHRKVQVEKLNDQFIDAVARGRDKASSYVRKEMGEGRMLLSREALAAGMVDEIATPIKILNRMNATGAARGQKAAMHITNIREFEEHLRDVGFPKQAARVLAAGGWKALESRRRDAETEEVFETETADLDAIRAWISEQRFLRDLQNERGTRTN